MVDIDIKVNAPDPKDIREILKNADNHSRQMNQPITLWKLIEILKTLGVIEASMTDDEILGKLKDAGI